MPFNRNHVRAFLAKTEIDLFESSLGSELKGLTAINVQRRIDRTRKLRTKYRDLLQRQKLATRARTASKAGTRGDANERTAKKAKAFDEALARFEAQAKHLEAVEKAAATNKRPKKTNALPAAALLREALEKKRDGKSSALAAQPTHSRKAPASSSATIGGIGATPPNVRAVVVASRLNQSGLKRIQGHTGTQVRMAQAKRDQRS